MERTRWLRAGAAALAALTLALAPVAEARSRVISSVSTTCRDIALTYDTEFSRTTESLVTLLDELKIKSTWFFVGQGVEGNPSLARRVAAKHQIGNHTYWHPEMPKFSVARMHAEISDTGDLIADVAGVDPKPLFRPPYGSYNNTLLDVTDAEGYPYVFMWSIDTADWTGNSSQDIAGRILRNAHPGAIVLQHGSPANTVEGTRLAVTGLRARGYQFVTLTELMGIDRHLRDFGGDTYVLQLYDSWAAVGACHNVTGPRLMAYNENPDPPVGSVLRIPHTNEVILRVNGERFESPLYARTHLQHGRSVAHVRLAERLGASVEWDGRVHVRQDEKHIVITPGDRIALVDGQPVDMGTEAEQIDGRTLVPVRFLAEQLGAAVEWDAITWTISLHTAPPAVPVGDPIAPPPVAPPVA